MQLPQILDLLPEILLGLHVHLPGAAEQVEIVHVQRAQIHLQRVKHFAHRNAAGLGGRSIDVQKQPGRVGAEAGEQIAQARRLRPVVDDLVGHALQRFQSGISPILDHDFESAGVAQAFQRRRTEHVHHAVANLPLQLRLQIRRDRVGRKFRAQSLVKIVKHHVHRAKIRRVGAEQNRLHPKSPRCASRPALCL